MGQSFNKNSDVVYNAWRKHPEWPMLHLTAYKSYEKYFMREHICTTCPYNSLPSKLGVHLLLLLLLPAVGLMVMGQVMVQENLIVYTERLPEEKLYRLQYMSGVHVCPSREEGFGHYINEARALGALVMTTDMPPMNELVNGTFGILIGCRVGTYSRYRSPFPDNKVCEVTESAIEEAMKKYFALMPNDDDDEEEKKKRMEKVEAMGRMARRKFEEDRDAFLERVKHLFVDVLPRKLNNRATIT